MSNRTLLALTEESDPGGGYAKLHIARSAAGRPGVLITITQYNGDDEYAGEETFITDESELIGKTLLEWSIR